MTWHEGRLVGFDTETTGKDPLEERIVTAAIVHVQPGQHPSVIEWIINPGTPIPDQAAAIHGWTTDRLTHELGGAGAVRIHNGRRMPMHVDGALGEIAGHLSTAMHTGTPVVVANAAYDLTLTETELARHDIDTLTSRPVGIRGIVDPQVLDKQFDPYRKVNRDGGCRGGRYKCGGCGATNKQLGSLCAHYGLRLPGAHRASVDAVAACRLARKLASLWPDIARLTLPVLHAHQVTWRRDQANSLRDYFDKAGIEHDGVDPGWPLHTALTLTGATR